jgi:UDP-glucose-4-epimerase GalE
MPTAKVLVTGGAGYVGSHICKALAAAGYQPITYDNLSRGHVWAVKWGPIEEGDIADTSRIRHVLERHRPDAVMHFAAYAYVGESIRDPLRYYGNNVGGTLSLLNALLSHGPMPIVFSSSCATYGLARNVPITEEHPQEPINPYGHSKLMSERALIDADRAYGMRSAILRYFNAAGADPEGEIGEAHDPETHLIPLALAAARDGTALRIFGDDYDTPDGTCLRDFVHVSDLAEGHLRALDYLLAGGPTMSFNLANARGYSVKEVAIAAGAVVGKPIRIEIAARREGDPPVLIGASEKAAKILGWSPKRSLLDRQVNDAWRWMRKRIEAASSNLQP